MYYIQENDKPRLIERLFDIVKVEENKIIIPAGKKQLKKIDKYAKKTIKILDKSNSQKVVLSKKIKQQEVYMNYLNAHNYIIVDGKWLFKMLVFEVIEYVIDKKFKEKKDVSISILTNDISEMTIYIINNLAKKYKDMKVVSNHIEKLKKIEEKVMENEGILIHISNNKRKVISNIDIVLNLDFPTELINRYRINNEAIIINFNGNVKIKDKRFNGLNINDYEIEWKNAPFEKETINKFFMKDLYETEIYQKQPIEKTLFQIKKDKIKIKELVAVRTKL